MKKIIIQFRDFFYRLKIKHVNEYAGECAFFTIISFIPFIIIFVSLIQYFNIDKSSILILLSEIIPSNMQEIIFGIVEEVYSKSFGSISIALLVALWTSGKGFFSLCKGFGEIYEIDNEKSNIFTRIKGTLYSLALSIILITVLIIRVFGDRIYLMLSSKFLITNVIFVYLLKLRVFWLILSMFFIFLLIYRILPRHSLKLFSQSYGALFASISCYLLSVFFSIYVDIFKGFVNLYGSLTTIILIMLWIYYCIYSILIGAELNRIFYKNKFNIKKYS